MNENSRTENTKVIAAGKTFELHAHKDAQIG